MQKARQAGVGNLLLIVCYSREDWNGESLQGRDFCRLEMNKLKNSENLALSPGRWVGLLSVSSEEAEDGQMGQRGSEVGCDSEKYPLWGLASFQPFPLLQLQFSLSIFGDTMFSGRSLPGRINLLKYPPLPGYHCSNTLCWSHPHPRAFKLHFCSRVWALLLNLPRFSRHRK